MTQTHGCAVVQVNHTDQVWGEGDYDRKPMRYIDADIAENT